MLFGCWLKLNNDVSMLSIHMLPGERQEISLVRIVPVLREVRQVSPE